MMNDVSGEDGHPEGTVGWLVEQIGEEAAYNHIVAESIAAREQVGALEVEVISLLRALGDSLVEGRFDKRYPKWIADRLAALTSRNEQS